jgi:transposase
MWVPPENRDPVLLHHPTRRSVGYFGAVRLRDGRFLYRRETERFGAQTFFDFLRQFSRANRATGRRMVLILDNASYHHARLHNPWRETHVKRISLEFLPAYSPELNPIERVWKFTRRRCLHNHYFPQLERVIEAVEMEFATWARHSESLRRLCAIS